MSVTRRGFLEFGKILAAACAFPLEVFGQNAPREFGGGQTLDLQTVTKDTFAQWVDSTFTVRSGTSSPTFLTLVAVNDLTPPVYTKGIPFNRKLAASQTPLVTFTLKFLGTGDTLDQGTYDLEHSTLGKFSLFVVPGEPSMYTAVVCHFQSAGLAPIPPSKIIKQPGGAPVPRSGEAAGDGAAPIAPVTKGAQSEVSLSH